MISKKDNISFTQKNELLSLTTADINKKRTFYYNKPDFTLRLNDIDGAKPKRHTIHLGNVYYSQKNKKLISPKERNKLLQCLSILINVLETISKQMVIACPHPCPCPKPFKTKWFLPNA